MDEKEKNNQANETEAVVDELLEKFIQLTKIEE
jgi:hypothetical protein